jgi:CheY-like chemotaxis protein
MARVLWVDDHPAELEHFLEELSKPRDLNISVDFASSADAAISKLRSENFEAIVLDLMIPEFRGRRLPGELPMDYARRGESTQLGGVSLLRRLVDPKERDEELRRHCRALRMIIVFTEAPEKARDSVTASGTTKIRVLDKSDRHARYLLRSELESLSRPES